MVHNKKKKFPLIVHGIETRLKNSVGSLGKIASRRKEGEKEGDFTNFTDPFISVLAVFLTLALSVLLS